jgi:hypothetical protein
MNLFGHLAELFARRDQLDACPLPTEDNITQKNADTHIHNFERSKTVRALDRAAIGIGFI